MRISGQPAGLEPQPLADERIQRREPTQSGVAGVPWREPPADAKVDQHTLKLIEHSLKEGQEIRGEKVAALKQAIAQGAYQVGAEQIAAAMLQELSG